MATINTNPFLVIALAAATLVAACSERQPESAAQLKPLVFKPQEAIPISLTLQKAEGQTGRTSPISSNYRPQVRFAPASDEPTCKVDLPASTPSLEPGQTTAALLTCEVEVRVEPTKREFVVLEGGKRVGQGVVQIPRP